MKEYDVFITVDVLQTVKANNEDEAVKLVNKHLDNNNSIIMDRLIYEVEEAWKIKLKQFIQLSESVLVYLH